MAKKKLVAMLTSPNRTLETFLTQSGFIDINKDAATDRAIRSSDMIVFTGGADIQPQLYGEANRHAVNVQPYRDAHEAYIYRKTRRTHYHLGICRGSQLLWVLNGGKLYQHVDEHVTAKGHSIYAKNSGIIKGVPSTHHQCAKVTPNFGEDRIIAWSLHEPNVTVKSSNYTATTHRVIEAHWHPITMSLGIQGHPEYSGASAEYRNWVYHLMFENPETKISFRQ